jgi:hypothetical protein
MPSDPSLVEAPVRSRANLAIRIGAVVAVLVVGVCAYVYMQRANNASTATPNVEMGAQTYDAVPQEKALYLSTYEGAEAIFYTNPDRNIAEANEGDIPYIGFLEFASSGITRFDYRNLIDPIRIASVPLHIEDIVDFTYNDARTTLYVSVILEERPRTPDSEETLVNRVYAIDLRTLSNREVWVNEVRSNTYESKGAADINTLVDDTFIVLVLSECYGCHAGTPTDALVVNMATKSETYLGHVGDIQINREANTVSYRNLEPVLEDCEPVWEWCTDQTTVMRPAGQTYTKQLR